MQVIENLAQTPIMEDLAPSQQGQNYFNLTIGLFGPNDGDGFCCKLSFHPDILGTLQHGCVLSVQLLTYCLTVDPEASLTDEVR